MSWFICACIMSYVKCKIYMYGVYIYIPIPGTCPRHDCTWLLRSGVPPHKVWLKQTPCLPFFHLYVEASEMSDCDVFSCLVYFPVLLLQSTTALVYTLPRVMRDAKYHTHPGLIFESLVDYLHSETRVSADNDWVALDWKDLMQSFSKRYRFV